LLKPGLLTFAILVLHALCFAADEPRLSRAYVTFEGASPVSVSPGKPAEASLTFRVKDGFHVNSNQPKSELLIPTTLKLEPPNDLTALGIVYPAGKDIAFPFDPSEKLNVYSEAFTVKTKLSAARTASAGTFTVHGQLNYQACSDNACFPPKNVPFQFDVHVVSQARRAHATTPQSPHIR
jgi:hypothetical protein